MTTYSKQSLDLAVQRAVAAERDRCALLVGAWPTKRYGTHEERLKVTAALIDMAAAIRAGKDRAPHDQDDE
jgi:hypothetical protein